MGNPAYDNSLSLASKKTMKNCLFQTEIKTENSLGQIIFEKEGNFWKTGLSFLIRMYSKYQNVEFVPEQLVGHFEDLD